MTDKKKPRSLRRFVMLMIGTALFCFIIIFAVTFYGNMSKMLRSVETTHMEELGDIVRGTLDSSLENLHSNTRTWSSWDETYDYILGENEAFIPSNLDDGTMLTMYKVDFVAIKDKDGNDLFLGSKSADEEKGGTRLEFPAGLSGQIAPIAADVLANQRPNPSPGTYSAWGPYCDTGFVVNGDQAYMLCVMPVLRSSESGPAVGTFTFVVAFGDEQFKNLANLHTTTFTVHKQDAGNPLTANAFFFKDYNTVTMYTLLSNKGSDRASVLQVDHPRVLYGNGMSLITFTTVVLIFILLALMAALYIILDRSLLRPVSKLAHQIDCIDRNEQIDISSYANREELYTLSMSINDMLDRLEKSHLTAQESQSSLSLLKSILNGLDAYLYVSDPVTDEILFINDKMAGHFGVEGDPIGKTCWKVLQSGFTHRCDFCPCYSLAENPGDPVVWEEHNTVTGRYYRNTDLMIDWIDDTQKHLQHSVDITDIKLAEFALQKRLEQQNLMTAVSQNFIAEDDLSLLIDRALQMTGEFMDIDRIMLGRYDPMVQQIRCENEWIAPDAKILSQLGASTQLQIEDFPNIIGMANGTLHYLCSDKERADSGNFVRTIYSGTNEFLVVPVFSGGALWGVIDIGRNSEIVWSQSDIDLAMLVASVLSGVLNRQGMEAQLRSLSAIVESSPQYISYLSVDGKVTYINPAATDITGYTEEELLAGGLGLIYDASTVKNILNEYIPETLKNGQCLFEIELIRKDGKRRTMAFSSFLTGNDDAIGCIARDVTEMRRLEAELIAAKDAAEQGSRAKGEFLSRMSHEMRTPMNAIIGMTNIAQSSDDPAKKEYCLEKIDNASRHLLGVINDILDMSKIESGKFELNYSNFNFNKMLTNVTNVLSFRMDEKKQKFVPNVDLAMPATLIGDDQRLAQVITNLLTNAVKFTPENGEIALNARIVELGGHSCRIKIEIIDTGIGISKEDQQKLFRSFEQADGSIARRFGGTGLGLAISKRIVELMDGEIWVESEPGKGSTFAFTISMAVASEPISESLRHRLKKPDLNILTVCDCPETRDYFIHTMRELEIPCVVAETGSTALSLTESMERPFNLIFIDWPMQETNGIELARALRERKVTCPITIVVPLAEWSGIEHEATAAGVDDFVPKPLSPSLLMDCINRHVYTAEDPEHKEPELSEASFSGKTVLLAEDVDINREIVLTILDDTGLVIDCVENGAEAVEMVANNPDRYDMIFMDIHMPEMDGLEATRLIRALDGNRSGTVPIVAMTANVFREDIEMCLDAGMNDHIGKPIDFDELFEILLKYLA